MPVRSQKDPKLVEVSWLTSTVKAALRQHQSLFAQSILGTMPPHPRALLIPNVFSVLELAVPPVALHAAQVHNARLLLPHHSSSSVRQRVLSMTHSSLPSIRNLPARREVHESPHVLESCTEHARLRFPKINHLGGTRNSKTEPQSNQFH